MRDALINLLLDKPLDGFHSLDVNMVTPDEFVHPGLFLLLLRQCCFVLCSTLTSRFYDLSMSFMLCMTARIAAATISPVKMMPMSPSKTANNRPRGVIRTISP